MIIHNSWMGTNPIIKTVMVVSDGNNTSTPLPYCNVLLPICLSTPELCTSKGNDSILVKEEGSGSEDLDDVTLEISIEVNNPLLSLPVIYMSRKHMQVSRSTTYLNANWKDASHLSLQHLMAVSSAKKKQKKPKESKEINCDNEAAKMVKVLKKSIEKSELKKKFECRTESPEKAAPAAAATATAATLEPKKAKYKPNTSISVTWAEIEKKLPFWQNLIADTLQKIQDLITRRR